MTTYKVVIVAYVWVILFSRYMVITNAVIGMNWGRESPTQMIPSVMVDLLLQNGIKAVKLLGNDDDILEALAGSGIEVSVTIKNLTHTITSEEDALKFVVNKIMAYNTSINFKYVIVLNNGIADLRMKGENFNHITDALGWIRMSLDGFGLQHIQTTVTHAFTGVLWANNTLPSEADFTTDVKNDTMPKILQFLNDTGSTFLFDFLPIGLLNMRKLDINYGFFDNKSTYSVKDKNGLVYNNAFDFVHDSFVWAMKKLGYNHIKIGVGMIGWPTDGYPNANVEMAERFWKGMLPIAVSNRGTPMRPGAPFDLFVNAFTDEKYNFLTFARHWGIYRSNGVPKYKIDFTGQGRDIYPAAAKGLNLMPARWCVFNNNTQNMTLVTEQRDLACLLSDCSATVMGGSCGILSPNEIVSYAFNAHFQMKYQLEEVCDFKNLGTVTMVNPSRDGCVFTREVVRNSRPPEITSF